MFFHELLQGRSAGFFLGHQLQAQGGANSQHFADADFSHGAIFDARQRGAAHAQLGCQTALGQFLAFATGILFLGIPHGAADLLVANQNANSEKKRFSMLFFFRDSESMLNAYGFSVILTMMMTTVLINFYLLNVRRWNQTLVAIVILIFSTVEISFFLANVIKIKHAYITLGFSFSIIFIMLIWHRARKITNRYLDFVKLKDYQWFRCILYG